MKIFTDSRNNTYVPNTYVPNTYVPNKKLQTIMTNNIINKNPLIKSDRQTKPPDGLMGQNIIDLINDSFIENNFNGNSCEIVKLFTHIFFSINTITHFY